MVKLRLRTKFLLSMVLITAGLTATSLLLVRRSIEKQVSKEIATDLQNSVATFQNFQRGRQLTLTHSAELIADLPNLRALMTTQHEATIQDASADLWKLAGSDLFVLADPGGHVVALHAASPGFTRELAQQALSTSLDPEGHWWFGGQHLYEVFIRPIYFGPAADNHLLGYLAVGYEINDAIASQISRIASSQVAFYYGDSIVKSTLSASDEAQLDGLTAGRNFSNGSVPEEIQLGNERFLAASTELVTGKTPSIGLVVLKSYDEATAFLTSLNKLLLALGVAAIIIGSGLVFLISHTFTRPLENLVEGARALGKGDFAYPLAAHGGDEVAELTATFQRMRDNLLQTQQRLLEAERLATIGRMASSISHDLRHSLTAMVANAEFLCETGLSPEQRDELYGEVRIGANQMTDLIDSLLEFSRNRDSLRPVYGRVKDTVDRAIHRVRTHPEFQDIEITVYSRGNAEGWFDANKLERAIFNLLLNACEAVQPDHGQIEVELRESAGGAEILVKDNGRGIPAEVRSTLFEPFVSFGKENGTGLGLTVVQKILLDHSGEVQVEKTSNEGTVFKLRLPLPTASEPANDDAEKGAVSSVSQTKPAEAKQDL